MSNEKVRTPFKLLAVGFGLGIAFSIGMLVGYGGKAVTQVTASNDQTKVDQVLNDASNWEMPAQLSEMVLQADSAATARTMAMATGRVDGDVEGLFVLDFLTGDLFCWVLSPTLGWVAEYRTNVVEQFGGLDQEGTPEYLMVTGFVNPGGRSGQNRLAETICYVGEASSGKVIALTFEWNPTAVASGVFQQGLLVKVDEGLTRNSGIERD